MFGGSGFLGAHVVAAGLERADLEHPLVSASRAPEKGPLPARTASAPELERVDALEPASVAALLESWQPARVVNCLALARVRECERDAVRASRINAEFPAELARWCRRRGARLVHVSTDMVFGAAPAPPGGFDEDAPPAPLGAYGATKAAGERAVLGACPGAIVVRLPLLYGDSGGRGLGASDSLLAAIAAGERPGLFADEWRTPLAADDAARALLELARSDEAGILHVAGPERVSRLQLGLAVLVGRGLPPAEIGRLVRARRRAQAGSDPPRPEDTSLDARRALRLLRTRPSGLRDGIARACS